MIFVIFVGSVIVLGTGYLLLGLNTTPSMKYLFVGSDTILGINSIMTDSDTMTGTCLIFYLCVSCMSGSGSFIVMYCYMSDHNWSNYFV